MTSSFSPIRCLTLRHQGQRISIRAVVHVAVGEDAETPIDLVAWTRERPDSVLRASALPGQSALISYSIPPRISRAGRFAGTGARSHGLPPAATAWCRSIARRPTHLDPLPAELDDCRLAAESLTHGRALRDALCPPLPARVRICSVVREAA